MIKKAWVISQLRSKGEFGWMLPLQTTTDPITLRSYFLVKVIQGFHIGGVKRKTQHVKVFFNSGRSYTFWDHCISWKKLTRSDHMYKSDQVQVDIWFEFRPSKFIWWQDSLIAILGLRVRYNVLACSNEQRISQQKIVT